MTEKNCFECNEHSGITHDMSESKEQRKALFGAIEKLQITKANSSQIWKVITVFLIISMAVVGWLWHVQVGASKENKEQTEKILSRLDRDSEKRDLIISTVNDLKTEVLIVKERVNTHIEQWPRMPRTGEHPSQRTGN